MREPLVLEGGHVKEASQILQDLRKLLSLLSRMYLLG
jgi:hypothetical protein